MTTQKATETTQQTVESMTGHGIVDLDARVVRATVGLVSQAGPSDLAGPTPCAGWTLGNLIGHMTAQHYGWTAAAAGHGADLSCWQAGPPAADPVREYAAAAGRVLEASAAARALAGRGRSVVLLEAFQPGHRRASSHGSARIFRRAYADPLYVRLTGQAQVLWRQLADEAGEEFVAPAGAVDFGPSRLQEKMYEFMTGLGVPAELMLVEAAAERWPGISFSPDLIMLHPDGGVIDPERAIDAMR